MSKTDIPDAAAPDANAVPEELVLGAPFAVVHDVELRERGGETCPTCEQPAITGTTSIFECDCGQLFRVDLLSGTPAQCPACERTYTHGLIVCQPDNPDAFLEALAVVLRANGYQVKLPDEDEELGDVDDDAGDDQADDDEDDEEEDDEEETDDAGDDEPDAGGK